MSRYVIPPLAFLVTAVLFFSAGLFSGRLSGSVGDTILNVANLLLVVVALIPTAFKLLAPRNLALYFAWQRFRARWFSRRLASWTFNVVFAVDDPHAAEEAIDEALLGYRSLGAMSVTKTVLGRRLYQMAELGTVQVSTDLAPAGLSKVIVGLINIRVGSAEAEELLEERIMPLLKVIRDAARPEGEVYSFQIAFDPRENPFLGLYLQWIAPQHVDHFQVNLVLPHTITGERHAVAVTKDAITADALSLGGLEAVAVDLGSLSRRLERRLAAASTVAG